MPGGTGARVRPAVRPRHGAGRTAAPQRLVVGGAAGTLGLGTGTQLGLAVARALATPAGLTGPAVDLAPRRPGAAFGAGHPRFRPRRLPGRSGQALPDEGVSPLVARAAFPEAWRVVLVLPAGGQGLHGHHERQAFQRLLARPDREVTDALCRLMLLGMLPALAERDLEAFGEAVYDFNRRVGEVFRPVQGGTYAHPRTAEVVAWLRQQGVRGVGQSSWGPAVFAAVEEEREAEAVARACGNDSRSRRGKWSSRVRPTTGRSWFSVAACGLGERG